MPRAKILRFAIFCHRWLGVFFCLLFATWFASGIVMMYWDYPSVSSEERLAKATILNASQIRISPQQAYARLDLSRPPDQARITMLDGRPVYRFRIGRSQSLVYAHD